MRQRGDLGACLTEETHENGHLQQEGGSSDEQDANGVDDALGDHCAQCLAEVHAIGLVEHSTTGELTHARDNQIGSIGDENGIYTVGFFRMLTQRLKGLLPTQATEHMTQYAKKQRQCHPVPRHLMRQHFADAGKVVVAIDKIEHKDAQNYREECL